MTGEETKVGLHYLWHLQAIGLIDENGQPHPNWEAYKQDCSVDPPPNRVKVAIIDNGCAGHRMNGNTKYNPLEHPNLDGRRLIDPVDFTGHVLGATYMGQEEANWDGDQGKFALITRAISDLATLTNGARSEVGHIFAELLNDNGGGLTVHSYPEIPDPSDRFAAHGTSCAGFVAGSGDECVCDDDINPNTIKYFGVLPNAAIIPINTVYNGEYWPMICALVWAVMKRADVILIPRGLEEMESASDKNLTPPRKPEPLSVKVVNKRAWLRDTRFTNDAHRYAEKRLFEALLKAVSDKIPVVIAAGNDGTENLQYPASLAVRNAVAGEPVARNLIVAGAVTSKGLRASYGAGHEEMDDNQVPVVFYAPSDDGEEISKTLTRFDDTSWRARNLKMNGRIGGRKNNNHSPYSVLAIDIPGQYGYSADPGPANDYSEEYGDKTGLSKPVPASCSPSNSVKSGVLKRENMPRELYTTFGGTSASASIIAGIVALHIAENGLPREGPPAMRLALNSAKQDAKDMETGSEPANEGVKIVSALDLVFPQNP